MRHEEEDLALPKNFMPMPPLGKDIDKLALAESPNPTPFGTLSILPRELRDEVYSHIISEGYPLWFNGNYLDAGQKKMGGTASLYAFSLQGYSQRISSRTMFRRIL